MEKDKVATATLALIQKLSLCENPNRFNRDELPDKINEYEQLLAEQETNQSFFIEKAQTLLTGFKARLNLLSR